MNQNQDENEDLLDVISRKDAEIEALHDEMQQLLGQWMFAEEHHLRIADMTWLEKQKISVHDAPDGEWELWRNGKRIQRADTVAKAIEVVRAFEGAH